jgi:hypothetical protein
MGTLDQPVYPLLRSKQLIGVKKKRPGGTISVGPFLWDSRVIANRAVLLAVSEDETGVMHDLPVNTCVFRDLPVPPQSSCSTR